MPTRLEARARERRTALDRCPLRRRGAHVDAVAARAREAPRDPRNTQAAIVENKREDLARDAARLERLERKMEDHEKLRDSEDADVTDEMRADARNYVATNSGALSAF